MSNTKAIQGLRWSPRPAYEYVASIDGRPVGPGTNQELTGNLAAWNLYWLSYPDLEEHTNLGAGTDPIFYDVLAPVITESVKQRLGGVWVADLIVNLPPAAFVADIKKRAWKDLKIAEMLGHSEWMAVVEFRAGMFEQARRDVFGIPLDFEPQNLGDRGGHNILPITKLFGPPH